MARRRGRAGPPGDRHREDDGRRREHASGRLLWGPRVAAETPADGHHLRRLVPGTGELCVCSWPCPEPHARQRGDRAVPNLPLPATAGTRAGLGGSAPIHALGHGRTPAVIRLCLRKSERVPSAAKPQTSGNEGPRWPPTAGTRHRGQTSVPVRGEYPSRRSPCGRLGWPVTPGTGRIPPKGPKRAQHHRRQSVVCTGRKLLSGYGRCQEGYHPGLPRIYFQDV